MQFSLVGGVLMCLGTRQKYKWVNEKQVNCMNVIACNCGRILHRLQTLVFVSVTFPDPDETQT